MGPATPIFPQGLRNADCPTKGARFGLNRCLAPIQSALPAGPSRHPPMDHNRRISRWATTRAGLGYRKSKCSSEIRFGKHGGGKPHGCNRSAGLGALQEVDQKLRLHPCHSAIATYQSKASQLTPSITPSGWNSWTLECLTNIGKHLAQSGGPPSSPNSPGTRHHFRPTWKIVCLAKSTD